MSGGGKMKHNLSMVRGTNFPFGVVLTNPDGTPFTLIDGQKIVFAVKKCPNDKDRLIVKTTVNQTDPGTYYLEVFPADTLGLEPGMSY